MFADQETKKMTAVRPTPVGEAGADKVIEAGIRKTATRTASITRIETLLDKVDDPVLAYLWRQLCPLHVDQLPDRQGIIADLAEIAEVLQPRLSGMQAPQLCRLLGAYAAKRRRCRRFFAGPSLRCKRRITYEEERGSKGPRAEKVRPQ